jgi:GTPase SAR1 family protein
LSNYFEIVETAFREILARGLSPFVKREMKAKYGANWVTSGKISLQSYHVIKGDLNWSDMQAVLRLIINQWNDLFKQKLGYPARGYINELIDIRNNLKHESRDTFNFDYSHRALDTIERLLSTLPNDHIAESKAREVADKKKELLSILTMSSVEKIDKKAESSSFPWHEICGVMLLQKQRDSLRRKATEIGAEVNVYVSLDLLHREERSRNDSLNPKREEKKPVSEIEKTYKHDDFLESLTQRQSKNRHIAIIGEAGAGKTTLLARIAEELNKQGQLTIFVSLADLQNKSLYDYIYDSWLTSALGKRKGSAIGEQKDDLFEQFKAGKIWLLLDGLDEMQSKSSADALYRIEREIQGAIEHSRVILTCRLNVWDTHLNGLSNFDTFRMGSFSPEQIDEFISDWFVSAERPQSGTILKAKLKESNRDRIRDMVRHPLRLALLCQVFYRNPNTDLPETKAGLYELFVRYFYEWKPNIVDIDLRTQDYLREELNQALGKLAITAIDSDAGFRLSRSFAVKAMGNSDLFNLACNVGWLSLIERNDQDEEVYSFFHATFQEYFAALAIDDVTYLLLNNTKDIPCGTYRILEQKWREVGLFWIGDSHKDKEQKNTLIVNLTDFQESGYCFSPFKYSIDKHFYGFHATFIAVILLGEYIDCSQNTIDTLMKQVSDFAFGCYDSYDEIYDDEQQRYIEIDLQHLWRRFLTPIQEAAKWALSLTNFTRANEELDYIKKSIKRIKEFDKFEGALYELEKFSSGSYTTGSCKWMITDINELLEIINFVEDEVETFQEFLNHREIYKSVMILDSSLHQPLITLDPNYRQHDLSKIGQDFILFHLIASRLGLIFVNQIESGGSFLSPASLIQELIEKNVDSMNSLKTDIKVIEYELKPQTDYFYKNTISNIFYLVESDIFRNLSIKQFREIVIKMSKWFLFPFDREEDDTLAMHILWRCSEVLSYPDFYQAWHPDAFPKMTTEKQDLSFLANQLIDCDAIQEMIDRTAEHPEIRCLVVDIREFAEVSNPNVIAKKLTNKIFNSIGRRIPVVQDVSCLERELLNLKFDLGVEKIAIALYGKSANEAINQLCQSLSPIQTRLFTGGQTSEQLINEVKAWLRRINLEYN